MKIIKDGGLDGIDKAEIDGFIAARKFIGLNRTPRLEEVIISLTSYDKRIHDVKYTIYSLLNQTLPADKVILWLDEDSFPQREEDLPRDLLELREFGLTIDWCDNLYSYKKLIPALKKYPNALIITADDDIFYLPDWLKILYDEYLRHPDCVVANRCRRIKIDAKGKVAPYKQWTEAFAKSITPQYGNFFTSGGGAVLNKRFFHRDILNREMFNELTPNADDIWFWAMTVLGGTKIKTTFSKQSRLVYVDIAMQKSGETLYSKNKTQNDIQFQRIMEEYPDLLNILVRETATAGKPYLSVVLLLKSGDKFSDFTKVLSKQLLIDFEVIVVNAGANVDPSKLPTNFKVVNYPGSTTADALNVGLHKATGEYILFLDMNTTLANNSLEFLAEFVDDSEADVVHFTGHINDGKFIRDGSFKLESDLPVLLERSKQNRALLWLNGGLSGRLETKIFKREFLLEHGINFDDGSAEFMFMALIHAEKYLLVPRAFCSCKD